MREGVPMENAYTLRYVDTRERTMTQNLSRGHVPASITQTSFPAMPEEALVANRREAYYKPPHDWKTATPSSQKEKSRALTRSGTRALALEDSVTFSEFGMSSPADAFISTQKATFVPQMQPSLGDVPPSAMSAPGQSRTPSAIPCPSVAAREAFEHEEELRRQIESKTLPSSRPGTGHASPASRSLLMAGSASLAPRHGTSASASAPASSSSSSSPFPRASRIPFSPEVPYGGARFKFDSNWRLVADSNS